MEEILKVENVIKYYGSGSVVTKAIDNLSFSVNRGEFTAIMGASGSGKSTLLNLIATIDNVSSGNIYLDGKNLCEMKERELSAFRRDSLGFIFQEYNLLDTLTIGENIALPLNLKRVSAFGTEKELKRIADILGVSDQLNKFPYELSGGQRQRAACARAIIAKPSLVLADEPTGALDSFNSRNLMKTFELMNSAFGSTILMVTHDAVVGSYAGRVLFLKDGSIWSELIRGERTRKEMYGEILKVMAALGGESDVG
jgi:hypothetical protein